MTRSKSALAARLLLGLSLVAFTPGCIAFIERGTRGGKVSAFASSNVQKGDKRSDVIAKLGEPDESATSPAPDGGAVENMTYKSAEGFYVIVYGKMEFSTLKVTLVNGVVDAVNAHEAGKDVFVLTGYNAFSVEPLR
jgi:hypothetical protein